MKPCCVKNDTKTVSSRVLSPVSMGLIYTCIYIIILIKTSQKFKYRVHKLTFYNNDFTALQDYFKVFRLSKSNFLDTFMFVVFFYGKQIILVPKLIILTRATVSKNWQSAANNQKWSSLRSELTTFLRGYYQIYYFSG